MLNLPSQLPLYKSSHSKWSCMGDGFMIIDSIGQIDKKSRVKDFILKNLYYKCV